MGSSNNYYVPSPTDSDYEGVSDESITRGIGFSKRSHRLLSGLGENENTYDGGSTGFKYLEAKMFSTKDVKFEDSDPSMLDKSFISKIKNKENCEYRVLRFDRSYNIRTFDFIITYTQLSNFQAKVYKPFTITKQFRGSLLFTGCSSVRNNETMEELPLKLYAKYESIGDSIGSNIDLDANVDTKGGPALTFKYTYDNNYVYIYLASISPFRIIPVSNNEYTDVSYLDDQGTFVGETKEDILVIKNPSERLRKTEQFSKDSKIWCEADISFKDTTISHTNADMHAVDFRDVKNLTTGALAAREIEFTIAPTNDGEQAVIGMAPASEVNLEIAPDNTPIRFGSRLLKIDMDNVKSLIEKFKQRIYDTSINTETVPFSIKTIIRTRGKYNIKNDYFVDSKADGFGQIIINDVGVYNASTDTFDITEYITDKEQLSNYSADIVKNYRKYINNASDYLSSISKDNMQYKHVRKTNDVLDVIKNIEFEMPTDLDVYYSVSYIRANTNFEVVKAFAEFGEIEDDNSDDAIVYICKDGKLRICSFKDYNMENAEVYDLFNDYLSDELASKSKITTVERSWYNDHYIYIIGTNTGIIFMIDGVAYGEPEITVKDAFIDNENNEDFVGGEAVSFIKSDDEYVYVGGVNGSIRIINSDNLYGEIIPLHFGINESIINAELISEDTVLFITNKSMCTYNLVSKKWNYEGDPLRLEAKFDNPFSGLKNENLDYIIDKDGFENVPTIQIGQFIYALGMRKDTSGYSPVYKKMNLENGKVIDLIIPDKSDQMFGAKLCRFENKIYSIGGSRVNSKYDPNDPDSLKIVVLVYNILTDSWEDNKEFVIKDGEDPLSINTCYPAVYDDKLYILYPKVNYFVENDITHDYILNTKNLKKGYVTDLKTLTTSEIDMSSFTDITTSDLNIAYANTYNKMLYFLAGERNLEYSAQTDAFTFKGYNLYKLVIDPETNTLSVVKHDNITSNELSNLYSGNNGVNAKVDMFGNFSIYSENNEAMIYCLDRECIFYTKLDVNYAEAHMVYHNDPDATYYPLLTEGEYAIWNSYGIEPGSITMAHIGNYIIFIGGEAGRVSGYLSLDTISMIPAPRYSERLNNDSGTAVIQNPDEVLKPIFNKNAIRDFDYVNISACIVEEYAYFIIVKDYELDSKIYLYRYNLIDKRDIEFYKDLSDEFTTQNGCYKHFAIAGYGKKYLAVFGKDKYDSSTVSRESKMIVIDTEDKSIINDNTIQASVQVVIGNNDDLIYISSDDNGTYVTKLSENVSNECNFTIHNELNTHINPTVAVSNGRYAVMPFYVETGIKLLAIDTYSMKLVENEFIVPNSIGFNNANISLKGNELYVSKGRKFDNNQVIYSSEIYKYNFNEVVGISNPDQINIKVSLSNLNISANGTPFVVTNKDEFVTIGYSNVLDTSIDPNNEYDTLKNAQIKPTYKLDVVSTPIVDDTFVSYTTCVKLTGNARSTKNRYKPTMMSVNYSGHELVFVFGGKESITSEISKVVEVYDTSRHMWKTIGELPDYLSNFTIVGNKIIGSTKHNIDLNTVEGYNREITFVCNDYDTLDFTISSRLKPDANYPNYAVYAKNGNLEFAIPTDANGYLIKANTIKIDGDETSIIYPIESTSIYSSNTKVLGATIVDEVLNLVIYNSGLSELSVWKYIEDTWVKVKSVNVNDIDYIANKYVTCDVPYSVISPSGTYSADAILTYVGKDGLRAIYFTKKNSNLEVSESELIAPMYVKDSIDSVELSSLGFSYYETNDEDNGSVYRHFPITYNMGIGCRHLLFRFNSDKIISSSSKENKVYVLYKDSDDKIYLKNYDIETGYESEKILIDGIDDSKFENSSSIIIGNDLWVISYKAFAKINLSNGSATILNDYYQYVSSVSNTTSPKLFDLNDKILVRYDESDKDFVIINYDGTVDDSLSVKDTNKTSLLYNQRYDRVFVGSDCDLYELSNGKVIYLGNKKRFVDTDSNGSIKTEFGLVIFDGNIPDNLKVHRIENDTIYSTDGTGRIFELVIRNKRVVRAGYTYSTEVYKNNIENYIVIRHNDIIDIKNGYRYISPRSIDYDHYCYLNIETDNVLNSSYKDKIVSLTNDENDATKTQYSIYISDKLTHYVRSRHLIKNSSGSPVNVPYVGKNMLIDDVEGNLHACIVDQTTGFIYNIDSSTGICVTSKSNVLKGSKPVNVIKIDSIPNTYVLHSSGNTFITYNVKTNQINEHIFNLSNGIVESIVSIDKYYKNIRVLYTFDDTDISNVNYGIFSGNGLDLIGCSETEIPLEYDKPIYLSNRIFMSNGKSAYEIGISEDGSELNIIQYISDFFNDKNTVDNKLLIETKTSKVIKNDNSFAYKPEGNALYDTNNCLIKTFEDQTVVYKGIISDKNIVITDDKKLYTVTFGKNETTIDDGITISNDIYDLFVSGNYTFFNIKPYYNSVSDKSLFGQFILISSNESKIISLVNDGEVDDIDFTNIYTIELDISSQLSSYNIDIDGLIFKNKSNTLSILSNTVGKYDCLIIPSETYGIPNFIRYDSSNISKNSAIFTFADNTYILDYSIGKVNIFVFGSNGSRKMIGSDTKVTFSTYDKFYASIMKAGIYDTDNSRKINSFEDFNILSFDPVKCVSEFYSKYIGVTKIGKAYYIVDPISEYEISSIEITSVADAASITVRSEGNVKAILNIIHKSSDRNIVAHIPVVTRLNTAKFVVDYDVYSAGNTGNIYSFLPAIHNGELVRDDISFYNKTNIISIIDGSAVKIKIDNTWYTYSRSDESLPFENDLLPIVMAFGTRKNSNEIRYFSFVDVKGNVTSYDTEYKTFVDIEGFVSVNVPFFSTEAMVYSSEVEKGDNVGIEVWSFSETNPYIDIPSSQKITQYAKRNDDLLN